jgi:hypothetical protein
MNHSLPLSAWLTLSRRLLSQLAPENRLAILLLRLTRPLFCIKPFRFVQLTASRIRSHAAVAGR